MRAQLSAPGSNLWLPPLQALNPFARWAINRVRFESTDNRNDDLDLVADRPTDNPIVVQNYREGRSTWQSEEQETGGRAAKAPGGSRPCAVTTVRS